MKRTRQVSCLFILFLTRYKYNNVSIYTYKCLERTLKNAYNAIKVLK